MKNSQNILIILALCAISSINAKQLGEQAPQKPVEKKLEQKKPAETFTQLITFVKNPHPAAWDQKNKQLNQKYVDQLVERAKKANIPADSFEILLLIARDRHAQFTGLSDKDTTILQNIKKQISDAVQKLKL